MTEKAPSRARRTIRDTRGLIDVGLIEARTAGAIDDVLGRFSLAITPSVAETIATADPDGGVARQYVPDVAELVSTPDELDDPIGDEAFSPVPGIVHRHEDRVLLNLLKNCAVYCRFCFRREQVGAGIKALTDEQTRAALDYIREHVEIWEVILSGGDPLLLPPKRIAAIAEALRLIDHVGVMRVHTRIPVVDPARINAAMLEALRVMTPTYVVVHVNHPDELTREARQALDRLADAGIPLLSQSVLLKGVNDNADTLVRLFRSLVECRVKPYYLHHPDKARGTSHFACRSRGDRN